MTIFGMLRIRNESRWIVSVVQSIMALCERVFIFDDHSSDGTPELCEQLDERCTVIRSPFPDVTDETRDKTYLLQRVMGCVSDINLRGDERSPFWALAIDGDEVLHERGFDVIRAALPNATAHAFSLPIWFLWDSDMSLFDRQHYRKIRTDGVYGRFNRPSIFRLFNSAFQYQSTPWGGNFHCSQIPQELLGHALRAPVLDAPLWHMGYVNKEDRIRKFQWYSKVDPHNHAEDRYMHMIQGDGPVKLEMGEVFDIPADAQLKHAGPLKLEMV